MSKLPLAAASLLLVIAGTSCSLAPTPSPAASPSVEPTASPSAEPTPDVTAPGISLQDPPAGGVLDASGITVTFSEPVRGVDRAAFQFSDAAGTVQGSIVSLDPTGRIATLVPEATLSFAARYTVTLSSLVHDLAGNALPLTSWTVSTSDRVRFEAGTYTGYRFGDSTADWTAIRRSTLSSPSSATATEYRVMDDVGFLLVNAGVWQGYWVHGTAMGIALDDLEAPIPPLPTCDYLDLPAARIAFADWGTTVLDTVFRLPSGYAPGDLVDTSQAGLNGSHFIRAIALQDLRTMFDAAISDGARLAVQSAYRSYQGQVLTFNGWVRQVGYSGALRTSARPGHSEHQLGTAIDFRSVGGASPWTYADWATSTEGAWLKANAWKFGWVMSYLPGTSAVSCYSYEPWHYRYVGLATAAAVHDAGVTLREWLWSQGLGVH
ncbi:MAG: D-alanyl-D-alanine carboxypeptidase family protein [Chloroflexota bacterium]